MDQAGTLRRLMHNRAIPKTMAQKPIRVISITSGKGGVGKTNITANLAVALQKAGNKVLILDGDFGLANMNIIMGLDVQHTIYDVLAGEKEVTDVVVKGPHGVSLIPSTSGILKMTQLSATEKSILMERLESIPEAFDVLLIDTGAGIHSDVAYLNAAASEVIVIATPEPTSITDAYALMKVMSQEYKVKRFKLIVNMVESSKEALMVYHQLLSVADRFLSIQIEYVGHVLDDKKVSQSVMARKLVSDLWPDSEITKCFSNISKNLTDNVSKKEITGNIQFFWRNLLSEVQL